jgi:hypothetical protein
MKTIYDLKLHEILQIDDDYEVMRVPGGLVYTRVGFQGRQSSVFVPFEVKTKPKIKRSII